MLRSVSLVDYEDILDKINERASLLVLSLGTSINPVVDIFASDSREKIQLSNL